MIFKRNRRDFPDLCDLININDVATEGLSADLVSRVNKKAHEQLLEKKNRTALASYITLAGTELVGIVAGRIAYVLIKKFIGTSSEMSRKLDKMISEPLITGTRIAQEALKELNNYSGSIVPKQTKDDLHHRLRSVIDKLETAYTHASKESERVMVRTIQGLCEAHLPPRRQSAKEHLKPFLEALESRGSKAYKDYRRYASDYVQPRKDPFNQFTNSDIGNMHLRDLFPHRPTTDNNRPIGKYGNRLNYRISAKRDDYHMQNISGFDFRSRQFGNFKPGTLPKFDEVLKSSTSSYKHRLKTHQPLKKPALLRKQSQNIKRQSPQKVKIGDIVEGRKIIDFDINFLDSNKIKDAKEAYFEWQHNIGVANALRKLCEGKRKQTAHALIDCPECFKKLRVPSAKNMTIHCPKCGLKFNKKT